MDFRLTGPDGRTITLSAPDGATEEQIAAKVQEVKANWHLIGAPKPETTSPEEDQRIAGPKRPTMQDVDLSPDIEQKGNVLPTWLGGREGGAYAGQDKVAAVRSILPMMTEEQRKTAVEALGQNAARRELALTGTRAPMGYGVTGTIAPHLWDKAAAGIDSLVSDETYEEAVAKRRYLRDKNWRENPYETATGGLATALALPAAAPFNATTRAGFVGNALTTGGLYGTLHGAGRGEGVDEGVKGALEEGSVGAVSGAILGRLLSGKRPQSQAERDAILSARRVGVDLPEAAASDSFRVQQEAGLLSKMPIAGTNLQKALNKSVDQVSDAIDGAGKFLASQAGRGEVGSAADVGANAATKAADWLKKTSSDQIGQKFLDLKKLVNPAAKASLPNTTRAMQRLARQDAESASEVFKPVIKAVMQATQRPDGLSFEGLLNLRTIIGKMQKHNLVAEGGTAEPGFKQIYGALTQDLRRHMLRHGLPGANAHKQFQRTMRESQIIFKKREALEKIIGKKGDINPETLVNQFGGWISDGARASQRKLVLMREALGDDVMSDLLATHLTRVVHPSGKIGEFSLANFDKAWKGIPAQSKAILRSLKGQKGGNAGVVDGLDALSKTVDNLQKVLGEINYSKTAYGNILWDKLQGIAKAFQNVGSTAVLATTGGAAVATGAAAGTAAGAATAAAPFFVGRWIANAFAKPASIRKMNTLLRLATHLTRSERGRLKATGDVAYHIKNIETLLRGIARDIMANEDAKAYGISQQEIEQYLLQELGPRSFPQDMPTFGQNLSQTAIRSQ